jgi:hypothetical protein
VIRRSDSDRALAAACCLAAQLLLTQYDFRGHFLLLAFQLVGALLAIGVFKVRCACVR